MSDKDQIKDLFSDKLGNFEAKVNPDLWANVASQVGTAAGATGTGGMSLLTKTIIGISGAAVVTTGVVLYVNSDNESPEPKKEEAVVTIDTPSQETPKEDPKTFVVENNASGNDVVNNVEGQEVSVTQLVDPNEPQLVDPNSVLNPLDPQTSHTTNNPDPKTDPQDPSTTPIVSDPNESKTIMAILPDEKVTSEDEPVKATVVDIVETPEVREEIRVIMPNVFTPDGDRRNDEYFMKERNVEFETFEFVVYNSRGEEVYKTNDPDFRWDGRDQRSGEYVDLQNRKGVFAYFITATTEDGRGFTTSNTITIQQ